MEELLSLAGQVALVTGGGNGMGRAYSHRLAGEGATVVVADIDGKAARRVAGEIGTAAMALEVDVTSEVSTAGAVRAVLDRRHPRPDAGPGP